MKPEEENFLRAVIEQLGRTRLNGSGLFSVERYRFE